jgi:hypothetical protein
VVIFCGAKMTNACYIFLYIFVMIYINNIYELHPSSAASIFKSYPASEYHEGSGGASSIPTCSIDTA